MAIALLMKPSTVSFQTSFSLWIYFFAFFFKQVSSKRRPLIIDDSEEIGRTLFSGNYDPKKEEIKVAAFMLKLEDVSKGMSVNRLTYAPRKQLGLLFEIDAQRRTAKAREKNSGANEKKFYGYASIKAVDIRSIVINGKKSLHLDATLTLRNPFHADIWLPVDEEKSLYMSIADALQQKAKFIAPK